MFCNEFREIFNNTYFVEHMGTVASALFSFAESTYEKLSLHLIIKNK